MKNRYFKYIEIEKEVVINFLEKHPQLKKFVPTNIPFYVRIYKNLYAGLIHTIISQNENSEKISIMWNQLNDFAKKVKVKKIAKLSDKLLVKIVGQQKAKIIREITNAITSGTLDLKKLKKQSKQDILNALGQFAGLSINSIDIFCIFSCFKQDILCENDSDFIAGLQIFLDKDSARQEDIDRIKEEYKDDLTLFSLCMWKIRNERVKR